MFFSRTFSEKKSFIEFDRELKRNLAIKKHAPEGAC